MLTTVFATKLGMTQAWTTSGKRVAVTRCQVNPMSVVGVQTPQRSTQQILEVGYGKKKLKNMDKPLRSRLEQSGFSYGVKEIRGVKVPANVEGEVPAVGSTLKLSKMLAVGDVVKVQGVSKGKGFAGAMKRHNFHGSQRTHGQSDRERAVGSIGQRSTPGRVFKGKRMPGHMGTDNKTVAGLVVLYIDPVTEEVWLNGPVPGFNTSTVLILKTGLSKSIDLDLAASGIKLAEVTPEVEATEEVEAEANPVATDQVANEGQTEAIEPTESVTAEETK